MEHLIDSPPFWVAVSFVVFLAFAFRPVSRMIARTLDARSEQIREELEEAIRLREEAQSVLIAYQKKQRESMKEAEEILQSTKQEAGRMQKEAQESLTRAIEQRKKLAQEKIARAESAAVQEVQNHVVDIAVSAAKALIVDHLDKVSSDDLIQLAISDIERKVH